MPPNFSKNQAIFSQFRPNSTKPTKHPCVVNSLIDLCNQGKLKEAVNLITIVARKGVRLDENTLAFVLKECARRRAYREGKWVHSHLRYTGLKRPTTLLSNFLLHFYFECGDHNCARQVFDKMSVRNLYSWNNALSGYTKLGMIDAAKRLFDKMDERDVVSWNTMVIGYAQCGRFREALRFYKDFRRESIGYNAFSFAGVLTVAVKSEDLWLSRQVHCQVLVSGFLPSLILSSSILDAYGKCGEMKDARRMFDEMDYRDIPTWTSLISGYCKRGEMELAREFFDMMPEKNPVSWSAIISGYARNNLGRQALEMFRKMTRLSIEPVQFTYSSVLSACANVTSLKHGQQIHARMLRTSFRPNAIVVSSLIDMYSKCGSLQLSKQVFMLMGNKLDLMSWNPMLAALAQHGHGDETIKLFGEMIGLGVKPNNITFVIVLTACSHSGLVDQGMTFFKSMRDNYNIEPNVEHYACVVDLLGRAGCFDELIKQLETMPCKDDNRISNSLIGVCRIQDNIVFGKQTAERYIERNPMSYSPYLLLSSIHAASGNWEGVETTRRLMRERCLRKEQASSWIETDKMVHNRTT